MVRILGSGTDVLVLVTGGTGLVGMALQEILPEHDLSDQSWIFCSSSDCDLESEKETRDLFCLHKPTHVVHLAAKVGGLFANMAKNTDFFMSNMRMTCNVYRLCQEMKIRKLITCLSTCIFPDNTAYPLTEHGIHNGPPHSSNAGYAYAKRMMDVLNHLYNEECGCNFTSIIPCNVFGKYDNFSLHDAHVIPALIHKCYLAREEGKALRVAGTGKPQRQFIYSKDLGRLLVWVTLHYNEIEPIILSVDEEDEMTIANIAYKVAESLGFHGPIVFDQVSADGQLRKPASNRKLRQYLPHFQFTQIDHALAETVAWFMDNYESIRK